MKLIKNDHALHFSLKDVFGRTIDLNDYRDKKVLIAFFRHAACPFCNLRVMALTRMEQELKEKGMEMIFFFESKERVILRSSFHKDVSPVPLISDPEKEWFKNYGVESSAIKAGISIVTSLRSSLKEARKNNIPSGEKDDGIMPEGESFKTMPAEFLLEPGLIIRKANYAKRLNDWIPVEELRAFADEEIKAKA